MKIKEYTEFKKDEIWQLYTQVGWTAYTENMTALERGYKNSLLVLAAYENEELLGIVRVVGMVLPLFLCRIFWYIPKSSGRASARRCSKRCWNGMRMSGKSNW